MTEIKWKSPYKQKIREETALGASKMLHYFHNLYIYRIWTKLTMPKLKSPLELELAKFVATEPRRRYYKRWQMIGLVVGVLLFAYDTRARQINDDVVDPGHYFIYYPKLFTVGRELRFKMWGLVHFHGGLLLKSPQISRATAEGFILEPFKLDYMLALQIDHYEKNRDKKFDFLSIGEQTVYQLI